MNFGLAGFGAALGERRGCRDPGEVEFSPVEQFPLDFFSGSQTDGGGQRQGEVDVEPGLLAFRPDGLNFQGIGGGVFFSFRSVFLACRALVYRLASIL